MPIIKDPFLRKVTPPPRELLSDLDKRDFILMAKKNKPTRRKFFHSWKNALVLDQKNTDYCTAFSTFAGCAELLPGRGSPRFQRVFNNESAFFIAKKQMSSVVKEFFRKLLPQNITRFKGRNMKAALWNFNHGVNLPGGEKLYLDAYYRCRLKNKNGSNDEMALEICRLIEMRGVLLAGFLIRGNNPFNEKGRYQGSGNPIYGHAILLVGFDIDEKVFYFKNSWGKQWGDEGYGEIPFNKVRDLREFWAFGNFYYQIPDAVFNYYRLRARDEKELTI